MKKILIAAAVLGLSVPVLAGPLKGHGHLIQTHKRIKMAIVDLEKAQKAHEYDLGGHAAQAEKLLREAEQEIKQAAEVANEKKK